MQPARVSESSGNATNLLIIWSSIGGYDDPLGTRTTSCAKPASAILRCDAARRIAGAPGPARVRQLRRMLVGRVRDGVSSGGDVLSRPCGGVAGAQERRGGRQQEHGQSDDEALVHLGILCECQIPTLFGAGGRPELGVRGSYGVAQSRSAALAAKAEQSVFSLYGAGSH